MAKSNGTLLSSNWREGNSVKVQQIKKIKLTFASNHKYSGYQYLVSMKTNTNEELFGSILLFVIFGRTFDER